MFMNAVSVILFWKHLALYVVCAVLTAPFVGAFLHAFLVASRTPDFSIGVQVLSIAAWMVTTSFSVNLLGPVISRRLAPSLLPSTYWWLLALLLVPVCTYFVYISSAGNIFAFGDGGNHLAVLNALLQPGPFGISPFDHIVGHFGTPYPQATHYLIRVLQEIGPWNQFSVVGTTTLMLYQIAALPALLFLYGATWTNSQLSIDRLIICSFVFGAALAFSPRLGLLPTSVGISSALFAASLINSCSISRHRLVLSMFLSLPLLDIHPSSAASLLFLINYEQLRFSRTVWAKAVLAVALGLIGLTILVGTRSPDFWRGVAESQLNSAFSLQSTSDAAFRAMQFMKRYFLFMGALSPTAGLVAFTFGSLMILSRIPKRPRGLTRTFVVSLLLVSAAVSGVPSALGSLRVLSIFWYSSPSRITHLLVATLFIHSLTGRPHVSRGVSGLRHRHLRFPRHLVLVITVTISAGVFAHALKIWAASLLS
jgi:hypothetical protein